VTARDLAHVSATLTLATLVPAVAVAALPRLSGKVRHALGFELQPTPGSLQEAGAIAATNARVVAAVLLAAWAVARAPIVKPCLDAVVVLVVGANAALIGCAIGGYGIGALPWLVHVPLELEALAVAGAAYRCSRANARTAPPYGGVIGGCAVLIAGAAIVESYVTPIAAG
jgi:hypothetical protein